MDYLLVVMALVWGAGAVIRVYRQARFFQIEEYMNWRYLRWWFAKPARWLPLRCVLVAVVGAAALLVLAGQVSPLFVGWMGVFAAVIAVYPPDEGEIKKRFKPTARAKRLLGTAFALALAAQLGWLLILATNAPTWYIQLFAPTLENPEALRAAFQGFRYALLTLGSLILLVFSPLALIFGNVIMVPVEAFLRARFVAAARRVLAEVHPVVVGVTGSYGKTTTKTFLAHILNGRYRAYPTPKSYNTMMGVCIAINNEIANDRSIDYFICEMGAYIPGEIERICDLTHPQISIVVEVGPQHLERFGTMENIAIAKYEIIKALPPDGVGIFNWDNPYVREMMERGYPATRIGVSRAADLAVGLPPEVRFVAGDVDESLDGLRFTVTDRQTGERTEFTPPLWGQHNVTNILLATAVAVHEGMSLREVSARVRGLQPAESRLTRQVLPNGVTVINDAYSANPVGIVGSLRVLALHQTGRRALITPGMVELGQLMESENRKLGELAAEYATDVVLVGARQTVPIAAGLAAVGFPAERVRVVETLSEATAWMTAELRAGDTVLFLNDLPDTYSS